ncbi:hemerythrin family protein [Candidatus Bathyarchaeota archaeon]|jgi:hemerythrin|nr:hemerythrin family protein [Candidatus Bathyarchaeota archaeon]
MAFIDWSDELSVQVAEIDQQHQKLVAMLNELHDAMREKKAKDALGRIIKGLVDYAGTHFATEEKYFDQYGYPGAATQRREHKEFVAKVSEFKQGFDEGRLMLSMDVMDFLENWLVTHIQGSDKKYGPFFNEKGLR